MAVTPVLSSKLKDSLGSDTGEELVAWMEQADTLHDEVSLLRREMQDFRREMQHDLRELRHSLEARMDIGFAKLDSKFERRISDLMKWSFVFWCGAVAAIAALAGVLR
jgi:hypothetical protein